MFGKRKISLVAAAVIILSSSANAENFYFRLRPSIQIENQESFSIRINGDRDGVVGSTFSAKAEATSPRETLSFSVTDGGLPPGVSIDEATGNISGRPASKGRFNATITARDAFSTASAPLTVAVYDVLEVESTIPEYATVGKPYTATFKGLGGDQTYAWTMTGGLPPGLSLNNVSSQTSTISGTPTNSGVWNALRTNVADGAGHTASSLPFSIVVSNPLGIAGDPPTIGTVGSLYEATFIASGGDGNYSWSLSGSLPPGLSPSGNKIVGTPSSAGTYSNIIVTVSDGNGRIVSANAFTIVVSNALAISGTITASGKVNVAYSSTLSVTGGRGPYQWESVGSSLPAGLTFNNGTISGTPTSAQTSSGLVFKVTDADGRVAQTQSLSIAVAPLTVREPASGEYYTSNTFWSIYVSGQISGSPCSIVWAGKVTQIACGTAQVSFGGSTYHRGSYRETIFGMAQRYGIYRTTP